MIPLEKGLPRLRRVPPSKPPVAVATNVSRPNSFFQVVKQPCFCGRRCPPAAAGFGPMPLLSSCAPSILVVPAVSAEVIASAACELPCMCPRILSYVVTDLATCTSCTVISIVTHNSCRQVQTVTTTVNVSRRTYWQMLSDKILHRGSLGWGRSRMSLEGQLWDIRMGSEFHLQYTTSRTKNIMPTSRAITYKTKCRMLLAPTQLWIHGQWLDTSARTQCMGTQRLTDHVSQHIERISCNVCFAVAF